MKVTIESGARSQLRTSARKGKKPKLFNVILETSQALPPSINQRRGSRIEVLVEGSPEVMYLPMKARIPSMGWMKRCTLGIHFFDAARWARSAP